MGAKLYVEGLLRAVVSDKGWEWPEKTVIEPPRDSRFGDLACNLALVLAKSMGTKPRDLAASLQTELQQRGDDLEKVEVAGAGFLNFTLKPAFWQGEVRRILEQCSRYGAVDVGRGRKVQVEFVSANPTGPLHIGHGRGAAVGDSLARILAFTGHEVSTEYYLNDAGRQMNMLGLSVLVRCQQLQGQDVELPEDCYQGAYIKDIASELLARHGDTLLSLPKDEALALCREQAVSTILDGIKADLQAFGVEHQVWFSERSLIESGLVEKTFSWLLDAGLAYEQDGALWFRATQFGDDKDRVLRKSDGSLTYFASDIAYHDDKYRRGFDLVVDIWGADHHGYEPRLRAAIQALGKRPDQFHVILVQLVNLLRAGAQVAMSTRAGTFDTLADVLDEVGSDAARFMFLSRKSDSHLDFDLDLVKSQSMENPVYYVQYGHARICSVFRKAAERGLDVAALTAPDAATPEQLHALDTAADIELLRHLSRFGETVALAALQFSPHCIGYYLQELAQLLHRYYTVNPVLVAPTEALVRARLLLLGAVARVFKNGLALLGVSAPDRM